MWDFPQYTSGKRAFNGLSRGFSEVAGAGAGAEARAGAGAGAEAGAGARASKTVLRICCKLSLEYWGTSVAVVGDFSLRGSASCLENSDLGCEKEFRGRRKDAPHRDNHGLGLRSPWRWFSFSFPKNTFLNELADPLGMEKLEL